MSNNRSKFQQKIRYVELTKAINHFYETMLDEFQKLKSFETDVFSKPNFLKRIEILQNELKKIEQAAIQDICPFISREREIELFEYLTNCQLMLTKLLNNSSLGANQCYEQFVVLLVENFGNFKGGIKDQAKIIEVRYRNQLHLTALARLTQYFDESLTHFKNAESFYENIFSSHYLVDRIEQLQNELNDIEPTILEGIRSFISEEKKDQLITCFAICKTMLTSLLDNQSLGVAYCYKQYIIPLVDNFWKIKNEIEIQRDILQKKRPRDLPKTSSQLSFNNLSKDITNEIFSYLSQDEKFEKRFVSKKFRQRLYDGYQYDRFSTQKVIETITEESRYQPPTRLYHFLEEYRASPAYYKLTKTKFEDMNAYEAICFALTRDAKHTHLLDAGQLDKKLTQISSKLPLSVRESVIGISLALKYDKENNPQKKKEINKKILTGLNSRKTLHLCAYLNLAGLNLQNISLSNSWLDLVDFTEADLSAASLFDCAFNGTVVMHAKLANTYFKLNDSIKNDVISLFLPPKYVNNPVTFKKTLDELWKMVQIDTYLSVRVLSLGQLVARSIYIAISNSANLPIADKIDLLDMAINHPMYKAISNTFRAGSTSDLGKTLVNYGISLFSQTYRNYTYAGYFPIRNIYFHEERKQLIALKCSLENDPGYQQELDKELTYYQALQSLGV